MKFSVRTKNYFLKKDKKKQQEFFVLLICLFISLIIWLLIQLSSDDNTSNLSYKIICEQVPADKVLRPKHDSVLQIGLKANGFKLLNTRLLSSGRKVKIDLSKSYRKPLNNGTYLVAIPSHSLINKLNMQIKYASDIFSVQPDTLKFVLEDKITKKVAVIPQLELSYETQFHLYQEIKTIPDSVFVSGPFSLVKNISYLKTIPQSFTKIKQDIYQDILLETNGLTVSTEKVKLVIDVEKYTERNFKIPIQLLDDSTHQTIKTFPKTAQLYCLVSQKDYSKLQISDFTLIAQQPESGQLSKVKKLPLSLLKKPNYVKNIRFEPVEVEFIILNR